MDDPVVQQILSWPRHPDMPTAQQVEAALLWAQALMPAPLHKGDHRYLALCLRCLWTHGSVNSWDVRMGLDYRWNLYEPPLTLTSIDIGELVSVKQLPKDLRDSARRLKLRANSKVYHLTLLFPDFRLVAGPYVLPRSLPDPMGPIELSVGVCHRCSQQGFAIQLSKCDLCYSSDRSLRFATVSELNSDSPSTIHMMNAAVYIRCLPPEFARLAPDLCLHHALPINRNEHPSLAPFPPAIMEDVYGGQEPGRPPRPDLVRYLVFAPLARPASWDLASWSLLGEDGSPAVLDDAVLFSSQEEATQAAVSAGCSKFQIIRVLAHPPSEPRDLLRVLDVVEVSQPESPAPHADPSVGAAKS